MRQVTSQQNNKIHSVDSEQDNKRIRIHPEIDPKIESDASDIEQVFSPEEVTKLAYKKYLARGGEHGSDQEDWLAAEQELREKFAKKRNVTTANAESED